MHDEGGPANGRARWDAQLPALTVIVQKGRRGIDRGEVGAWPGGLLSTLLNLLECQLPVIASIMGLIGLHDCLLPRWIWQGTGRDRAAAKREPALGKGHRPIEAVPGEVKTVLATVAAAKIDGSLARVAELLGPLLTAIAGLEE